MGYALLRDWIWFWEEEGEGWERVEVSCLQGKCYRVEWIDIAP